MPNYRINEFSLIKLIDPEDVEDFHIVKDEINLNDNHFVDPTDIDQLVWDSGDYEHRLNKTYSENRLYDPSVLPLETFNYFNINVLLKQGYSFENVFGIHILVKSNETQEILISKVCFIDDFNITENKELIDGSFWLEECIVIIPDKGSTISCAITEITYDDIKEENPDIGLIYNYPNELTPLIESKPAPEYITNPLSFNDNHFLTIELHTTENKTIKQSILDYFDAEVANVSIRHIVNYGNETIGYNTIIVVNGDNKYAPVSIGLDLLQFVSSPLVNIFVSTEILVDAKLIKRENQINTDISTLLPLIQNEVTHPETNYPVEVVNETVINQQVIESKTTEKIIPIYQPIYTQFIEKEFTLKPQNISFASLQIDAYLKILESESDDEQIILSKRTIEGSIYFDLSLFNPISEDSTYELISSIDNKLIGAGNVKVNI